MIANLFSKFFTISFALFTLQASISHSSLPPFNSRPSLNEIVDEWKSWATLRSVNGIKTEILTLGLSTLGHPTPVLKFESKQLPLELNPFRPTLIITGGIHGNEYLGFEHRLPQDLIGTTELQDWINQGGLIYWIPIFNPDGYLAEGSWRTLQDGTKVFRPGKRGNGKGVDLNRDYPLIQGGKPNGFRQQESRNLIEFLKEEDSKHPLKIRLLWNYHCCGPAVIHRFAFSKTARLPASDLLKAREVGKFVEQSLQRKIPTAAHTDIFDYLALGTQEDYFYETYGTLSLVYEGVLTPRWTVTKSSAGYETGKMIFQSVEWIHYDRQIQLWQKIFARFSQWERDGAWRK